MITVGPGWQKIVGHDWAVRLLHLAIDKDRVGHAYLITGPDQIGKMTLARTFAQALNCTADEIGQRPCGKCRACTLIAGNRHPDVRVVLPEVSERGIRSIKIEQIRQLQQDLSLSAYEARYKIALLKRFDTANVNAANAFLKTLEEPPANVILILTAADSESLLPTIISRCRVLTLRPIPTPFIEESLMTRWQVKTNQANLLAHLAGGRIGWAIEASSEPALLQSRTTSLDRLSEALQGNLVARFNLAERLSRKSENLPVMMQTWSCWWRDLALLAFDRRSQERISNIDQIEGLHKLAGVWPSQDILRSLVQTERAMTLLKKNANARLVLENVFLTYPAIDPDFVASK
ncbi:MAG: DNA polymerase III subunit delta' [Chloroflexota bacterium]|jgi:DNA polymerase III subunit delta'